MEPLGELVGDSPGLAAVREQVRRLLQHQSDGRRLPPVVIQGETGTGKGLLAQALHRTGPRREGPFVDLNCAAIPETLLESELFGFERGAFTDARHAKPGLFQLAHRGALFLDEVALLPDALQAKLLKVIEERVVRRLGGTRNEPADAWIIAASNEDLGVAVRERRFREDLYHRLAVVTLWLPPLRERGPDVLRLAEHFLGRACADYGLPPKVLAPEARTALLGYRWPGNVRELANVMERVALLTEGTLVTAEQLSLAPLADGPAPPVARAAATSPPVLLEDAVGNVERQHLLEALGETGWNVTRAAARLGISRDTLRYRIAKHNLRAAEAKPRRRQPLALANLAPGAPTATATTAVAAPAAPALVASPTSAKPRVSLPEPPAVSTFRWERRRLTFLRAAVPLAADADPRLVPSWVRETLVQKVESFGGRVEELGPAGLLGVFGLEPIEDAPARAAHAAMAIRKERERRGDARVAAVRCAIHLTPCLVGRGGSVEIDFEGKRQAAGVLDVLTAACDVDDIVASAATRPFLERHFAMGSVPGGGDTEAVYRLLGGAPGPEPIRREAPFVGRARDLDFLRSRLDDALRGHGQVVGILGEIGIGKSRLVAEFRRSLGDLRISYFEGHCRSYGSAIPLLPVIDIVRQNFRIDERDGPDEITEKVRVGLTELSMDPDEWAPGALRLLGVTAGTERLTSLAPGAIKARTFETLKHMGLQGCRRRPVIFVVEDFQWVDATSEECFAFLLEGMAGAPALLIATYRPGYRPLWVDKSYATQVALQPLPPVESRRMLHAVLARKDLPEAIAEVIVEKSEGNPFFLEELGRVVGDQPELRLPPAVPDTIQEVLLARLDRLPEQTRSVLQTAAVLGREVPMSLLRAVWEGPSEIEADLHELTRLEFLYARSGGMEPAYAFTHTLTREVAEESLPEARRRALHLAAGQALERAYAGRLEEAVDRLAYHYAHTDDAARAVGYLARLGERAARGHAYTEAGRALDEALRLVEGLPPAERDHRILDLTLRRAYALVPLGAFQAIVDLLLHHESRVEQLGSPQLAGPYHFLLGRSHLFLGKDDLALGRLQRAVTEATRGADESTLGLVHYALAQRGALSGRPREGLGHARQAVEILTRAGVAWWVGPAHVAVAWNHALLGELAAALAAGAESGAAAEAVEDTQARCVATWTTGIVRAAMGETEGGIAACRDAVELAPAPLDSALALGWLGFALSSRREFREAAPHLEQAIALLDQFGFAQPRGWFLSFLADARRREGRLDEALALARQAAEIARASDSRQGIGWAARALGHIALAHGRLDEARARFEEALGVFTTMEARYEIARSGLDLAAIARARGDAEGATRHTAEAQARLLALGVRRGDPGTSTPVTLS